MVSTHVSSLRDAMKAVALWCGAKADVAVDEFMKQAGKHGWKVAIGWMIANHGALQNVLKAAEMWLKSLP